MHTASGIFMDEAAFMFEVESAFTAAKPSIDGGGRITMVSSANPGFFESMVNDKTMDAERQKTEDRRQKTDDR